MALEDQTGSEWLAFRSVQLSHALGGRPQLGERDLPRTALPRSRAELERYDNAVGAVYPPLA